LGRPAEYCHQRRVLSDITVPQERSTELRGRRVQAITASTRANVISL
jgi:hypothetical protein